MGTKLIVPIVNLFTVLKYVYLLIFFDITAFYHVIGKSYYFFNKSLYKRFKFAYLLFYNFIVIFNAIIISITDTYNATFVILEIAVIRTVIGSDVIKAILKSFSESIAIAFLVIIKHDVVALPFLIFTHNLYMLNCYTCLLLTIAL